MLQKMLQSEKNATEILDAMDMWALKNAKIQTKTHEMDVLEAVENETLESHNRSRGFEALRVQTICRKNNPAIWGCTFRKSE